MKRLAVFAAIAMLQPTSPAFADSVSEQAASEALSAMASDRASLRVFLQAMPKGGDLHNHLGGVPSAEDWLGWAEDAGYCADRGTLALLPPPCKDADKISLIATSQPFEYARLVDHFSTRGWQRGIGANEVSGHTQFFRVFERIGPVVPIKGIDPAMLTVAMRNAASANAAYLELMHTPSPVGAFIAAAPTEPLDAAGLPARLARELPGVASMVAASRAVLDKDEATVRTTLKCGTAAAEPACDLAMKYLGTGLRALPPGAAFRSLLAGFALAAADPRYVGVNIAMPEDWPVARRDYDLHMAMFKLLKQTYPGVHVTMHAAEVALDLVPPADQKDHMRKAIEAGAERIGHGTGIAMEADADATLRRMAREGIAVEINLSSNAVILGVSGSNHPLHLYRRYGVPVMLSTDDEGILRTDLTNEYVRAVTDQGLGYRDLKQMARASLEHAFLPGESIWQSSTPGKPVAACVSSLGSTGCRALIARSEKAAVQARYELKLEEFEKTATGYPKKPI